MEQENKKLNLLAKIIIFNIVFTVLIGIILTMVHETNLTGIVIFVLVNIIMLLLSKLLSKKKIILVFSVMVYFIIIFITPVYKVQDHEHVFYDDAETIYEYTIYYNPYYLKINKVYQVE